MKKVSFITLGCKVNQYESNGMAQKLMGKYEIVDQDQIADIYIVNTCSVTNIADRKSRQALRRCKEHNKDALVIAVGCYVDTGKEDLEKIEEVDLLLNNYQKRDIDKYIERYYEGKKLELLLKFKMDVTVFAHIVLFHMLEEEYVQENLKALFQKLKR